MCEEKENWRWLFIEGAGDRAGALGRWAGAHPWCPSWLPLLHLVLCFDLMQKKDVLIVVGRWKDVW